MPLTPQMQWNDIGEDGARALALALQTNDTLTALDLCVSLNDQQQNCATDSFVRLITLVRVVHGLWPKHCSKTAALPHSTSKSAALALA